MTLDQVVTLLKRIAASDPVSSHDIVELQGAALGGKVEGPREVLEVLRTLAQDLDNFEADSRVRKEDPSFFGDKDARALCVEALAALATVRKP